MRPEQQVKLRQILTGMMEIAHGLGTTYSEDHLLAQVRALEMWIDGEINLEVTKAIQPFIRFDIKEGGKK
jgi:hypothetical protein